MSAWGRCRRSLHEANFFTFSQISQAELTPLAGHRQAMLTETYIEALLGNEELAGREGHLMAC